MSASPRLSREVTYRLNIEGVSTLVTPPADGWKLVTYQSQGEAAGALMSWRGPSGFRDGTLNVLMFDVGIDLASAWDRIETLSETAEWGTWTWTDRGTTVVGSREAQWQEARAPDLPVGEEGPAFHFLVSGLGAQVWANSSVRFYVVPIDDLTLTLVAFENRCSCLPNPLPNHAFGGQMADDTENELSMWLNELDGLLANLDFEQA